MVLAHAHDLGCVVPCGAAARLRTEQLNRNMRTKLVLLLVAVLVSLIAALAAALVAIAMSGSPQTAVTWGSGAFTATLGLALTAVVILLS